MKKRRRRINTLKSTLSVSVKRVENLNSSYIDKASTVRQQ